MFCLSSGMMRVLGRYLADRPTLTAPQNRGGQHYNRLPTRHSPFPVVQYVRTVLLLMAVILQHLGCQKLMKKLLWWDNLPPSTGCNLFVEFPRWVSSILMRGWFDPTGSCLHSGTQERGRASVGPKGRSELEGWKGSSSNANGKGQAYRLPRFFVFWFFLFLGVSLDQPWLSEPKQLQRVFYVLCK